LLTSTNINVYQTVYNWCKKILAKENLRGNIGISKNNIARRKYSRLPLWKTLSYRFKFSDKIQIPVWTLGMSVQSLRPRNIVKKYLKILVHLKIPGCFAMTPKHMRIKRKRFRNWQLTIHQKKTSRTFIRHTNGVKKERIYRVVKPFTDKWQYVL